MTLNIVLVLKSSGTEYPQQSAESMARSSKFLMAAESFSSLFSVTLYSA